MKKKGFTLIELLAVIVVLAIIALIATPIVMNTIKNSKKGAAERTADNYIKQVETLIMEYRMKNNESLPDGTYDINEDGNLTGNGLSTPLKVEMSGTKPSSGSITIENGQVKKENSYMKVGDYTVKYDETNKTFVAEILEVLCTANTTKVSALVWGGQDDPGQASSYNSKEVGLLASESGSYTPGVTYTCNVGDGERTFYVLEENGDNLSLILGTNLGTYVAWSSDGDNSNGPVTALAYLSSSTENWSKLDQSQIILPSKEQISQLYSGSNPTWLHSYTDENVTYAYWTSTPNVSNSTNAWYVDYSGNLHNSNVDSDYGYGVRPVITISKTQLG